MNDIVLTLSELLNVLKKLNVTYKLCDSCVADTCDLSYKFKSLRKIEEFGIYFFSGEGKIPKEVTNSVVLIDKEVKSATRLILIRVQNAQLTFYKLMNYYFKSSKEKKGIHETSVLIGNCRIHPTAYIGPYCVLEDCTINANAYLHSHVTVYPGSTIDEHATIESHSSIGVSGVAWIWDPETNARIRQPQVGYTHIGKGVFLGSDISVVRGSVNEVTTVGDGCVIAHGSKIGHGTLVGRDVHFANNVTIAGNVFLGDRAFLGAAAVVRPQVKIAADTVIGAGAVIVKDINEAGRVYIGSPGEELKKTVGNLTGVPKKLRGK